MVTTEQVVENFLGCNNVNLGCVLYIAGTYFGQFGSCALCSSAVALPACALCIAAVLHWGGGGNLMRLVQRLTNMNIENTTSDGRGLPLSQSLIILGALVVGLAVIHFLGGTPSGIGDWLRLAATAFVSPAIGYYVATRKFGTELAIALFLFALIVFGAVL